MTYGATNLEMVHVEYALLARALRDLTARVVNEQDRTGVHTWGLARLARLPADLELTPEPPEPSLEVGLGPGGASLRLQF